MKHFILKLDFLFKISENLVVFNFHLGHFFYRIRDSKWIKMIKLQIEDLCRLEHFSSRQLLNRMMLMLKLILQLSDILSFLIDVKKMTFIRGK